MPDERTPMPFGQGLDRASGLMVVDPASMADLRNVLLYDGKAQARRGFGAASALINIATDPMDDVLALYPFRAKGKTVAAAWLTADRKVEIFAAGSTGGGAAPIDAADADSTWFTADAIVGAPLITMAESYLKMFMAHYFHPYKPSMAVLRAPTKYYDPAGAIGSRLLALNVDLGGGAEDICFAGVCTYLNYMVGWGYGNKTQPDRPEIVRVSLPGDPTSWVAGHYFIAGVRGDPVVACGPAGSVLSVFKESETYEIRGTDRTTFGIIGPVDYFGQAGPRLGVTVGHTRYFWSLQGPRMTTGGQSADIALPLDLAAPQPSDLVAAGVVTYGFAEYDPDYRRVLFFFPSDSGSQTLVYVLHVRDPKNLRMSYDVIGKRIRCAAVYYSAQAQVPSAYPDATGLGAVSIGGNHATLRHLNNGNDGDENVQYWMRVAPLTPGTLAIDAVDAKKFRIGAGQYTINGAYLDLIAETTIAASAGHVVSSGFYGIVLVQRDNTGATSTKVPGSPQAYASAVLALAALPSPDAGKKGVGYITIFAQSATFTFNTDDLNGANFVVGYVTMAPTAAGAWAMKTSLPVSGVGDTQSVPATGLASDTTYNVSRRYERGGVYNAGAENTSDPTTWPAASKDLVTTTALDDGPVITNQDTYGPYTEGGIEYVENYWDINNPSSLPFEIYESLDGGMGGAYPVVPFSQTDTEVRVKKVLDASTPYWYQLRFTAPLSDWSLISGPIYYLGV